MTTPPPLPKARRRSSATQTTLIILFIPIAAVFAIGGIALFSQIHKYINDPQRLVERAEADRQERYQAAQKAQDDQVPATSIAKPRANVVNSAWDGSVSQVKRWAFSNIADPEMKLSDWSPVVETPGGYMVACNIRARNAFGGWVIQRWIFTMDKNGKVTGGWEKN